MSLGTHHGTHLLDFLVLLGRDALPAIALVASQSVATVHASHHLDVGVPELPRDELVRCAGAYGPNGVKVPRVVDAMMRKPKDAQALAMDVADAPAMNAAE